MATVRTLDSCFLAGKIRALGEEVEVRNPKELASAVKHRLVEILGEPIAGSAAFPPLPPLEPGQVAEFGVSEPLVFGDVVTNGGGTAQTEELLGEPEAVEGDAPEAVEEEAEEPDEPGEAEEPEPDAPAKPKRKKGRR